MIASYKDKPTQISDMLNVLGIDHYKIAKNKMFLQVIGMFARDEVDIDYIKDIAEKLTIFNPEYLEPPGPKPGDNEKHIHKYKFVIKQGLDICECGKIKDA